MFKQGLFAGVDAAPYHYPPSTIDTTVDATVVTMIQTAVNLALEAWYAAKKRHNVKPPQPQTTQPPPTRNKHAAIA